MSLINNINDILFNEDKVEVRITWRSALFLMVLSLTFYLNFNAVVHYYEDKAFIGLLFMLTVMSYLYSIFLVRLK